MCQECVWNVSGMCLDCVWDPPKLSIVSENVSGMCLECVGDVSGRPVGGARLGTVCSGKSALHADTPAHPAPLLRPGQPRTPCTQCKALPPPSPQKSSPSQQRHPPDTSPTHSRHIPDTKSPPLSLKPQGVAKCQAGHRPRAKDIPN